MVGKTGYGKTNFVQKLAVNNLFGDIKKVEWVSQIELSKFQEAKIQSRVSAPKEFYYNLKVDELEKCTLKQSVLVKQKTRILLLKMKTYLEKKKNPIDSLL